MSERFEWADVTAGSRATIWTDGELLEVSEDGAAPDEVGVSMTTGSNGIMLYGQRDDMLAWAEGLVARLRAGEGRSQLGEVKEFRFQDRLHRVRLASGSEYQAEALEPGDEIRDNAGAPAVDGELPEPEGRTWRVMKAGQYTSGGYVVVTRQVLGA